MRPVVRRALRATILVWAAGMALHSRAADSGNDIEVSAKKVADTVVIDVSMLVSATPREAWDVLTDYDKMPSFLPNLQVSKIISRSPTRLQVVQKGGVSHGPITITFDVIRDVQLKPYSEVISHVVSGNLKQVDGTTRIAAEGEATRVTFHSVSIPNVWVPPGIGPSMIESETRDQFGDMRAEILRRKSAQKQ
ncbi:MAG: SRPBCC family protein [Herminiimonas sp.]|nr:SRPBCC family protein [Herminiimonas sp.]